MKVLISAYFFEPERGSEHGVGWRWACEIADRGHETWVLTRSASRAGIVGAHQKELDEKKIRVVYIDLPGQLEHALTRVWRFHYLIWQYKAYRQASRIQKRGAFDLVHHLTMGDIKQHTFMGNLNILFLLGPLGGGETTPFRLRSTYDARGWLSDLLRDFGILLCKVDPLLRREFHQANRILVRSHETMYRLPRKARARARSLIGIGLDEEDIKPLAFHSDAGFRIIFVGRLIHWKGAHLALQAFAQVSRVLPAARLSIVGRGRQEKQLRDLSEQLQISDRVQWITRWLSQEEIDSLYRTHGLMLFPSLHEAGGTVIFEALARGLPVVCLDLGGPRMLIDSTCGRVVPVRGRSAKDCIEDLSRAVLEIANDQDLRLRLATGAQTQARQHLWRKIVGDVYGELEHESAIKRRSATGGRLG